MGIALISCSTSDRKEGGEEHGYLHCSWAVNSRDWSGILGRISDHPNLLYGRLISEG